MATCQINFLGAFNAHTHTRTHTHTQMERPFQPFCVLFYSLDFSLFFQAGLSDITAHAFAVLHRKKRHWHSSKTIFLQTSGTLRTRDEKSVSTQGKITCPQKTGPRVILWYTSFLNVCFRILDECGFSSFLLIGIHFPRIVTSCPFAKKKRWKKILTLNYFSSSCQPTNFTRFHRLP